MSIELGKMLIKKKQFSKALFVLYKILKNKPHDLRTNFQIGKIFYELNDLNKSIIYFQKCNEIQPNSPNILFNLALVLQSKGQIEDAKRKYLKLITLNNKDVQSYYGLHSLDIKNITPEFYKNLVKLNTDQTISIFEKSLINFIFSKIEEGEKNLNNEIKFLELSHKQCYEANLLINEQSDFYYKSIISNYFDKVHFESEFKSVSKFNNLNHIFIIGLPRSGSSLVETIISHNENNINSVGEFHGINTSILEQIGKEIYSENFNSQSFKLKINKKLFQESLIEKYDNFETKTFLDKSLENFFNIEIILKFFPNAKFINTYRNFNDAVIGIYKTMLPELSWCHNIKDIINYIKLYEKTIMYFKKKYPDKIIDVELNKLTNNKEIEAQKILKFCKIELRENYLDFNKNQKLFNKTNSFLQVREKIKKYDDQKYQSYYHLIK